MGPLLAAMARTGPAALPAGTLVGGQYRIERPLGEGGMGVVYLARDKRLDRDVAVKVGTAVSRLALERIEREAMALARLSHPNVVVVFQVGEIEGRVFIAMEHVDGGTARAWLAAQPRTTREILALYAAAGDGLAAAHAAGLIHRDFKPDNVLVGGDGRPRVADFGLARATDAQPSSPRPDGDGEVTLSTQTGAIVGTPAYMPPEQLTGGELDARADQFAFAASLWEALFGTRPFDGKTPADVAAAITSKEPTAESGPGGRKVPRHVATALRRALSPEREDRWPDLGALVAELRRDPVARRRRLGFGVATLAMGAAAAATIILVATRGEAPPPCRDAGDTTRSTWTPARRDELRAKVVTATAPTAGATFDRLAARLDQHVGAIGAARIEACRATHVRRTQSAALLDLRSACLDQRETEVAALIGVLTRGGPATLDGSLPAAYALRAATECDDAAQLRTQAPPPADPATRAERDAVVAALAEVDMLGYAGQEKVALEAATAATTRAAALGDRALEVEGLLLLAGLQAGRDGATAMTSLERAGRLAAEVRDDELAARVAISMFAIVTSPIRQLDEAERLRPLAESALVRAGSPPRRQAAYLAALSRLREQQGDYLAARDAIERSLTLTEAEVGPDHPKLANSLNHLSVVMTNQGQLGGALDVRRRTERILTAAYGSEHPHVAVVITNLGITEHKLGRYEEAIATLGRALAIKERTLGPDHPSLVSTLINQANALLKLERAADAVPRLERARTIVATAQGTQHPAYAHVLSVMSDARRQLGDPAASEALLVEVLAIQSEAGADRPEIAETLLGLSEVRRLRGDLRAARTDLDRARGIVEKTAGPRSPMMAWAMGLQAELELAEGTPGQARRTMEQAIAIMESAAGADHADVKSMRAVLDAMPPAR